MYSMAWGSTKVPNMVLTPELSVRETVCARHGAQGGCGPGAKWLWKGMTRNWGNGRVSMRWLNGPVFVCVNVNIEKCALVPKVILQLYTLYTQEPLDKLHLGFLRLQKECKYAVNRQSLSKLIAGRLLEIAKRFKHEEVWAAGMRLRICMDWKNLFFKWASYRLFLSWSEYAIQWTVHRHRIAGSAWGQDLRSIDMVFPFVLGCVDWHSSQDIAVVLAAMRAKSFNTVNELTIDHINTGWKS